jgi:guanylate kinase
VISGPSGAGKSTIVRGVLASREVEFSVSATTRAARPGEIPGQHYHFIDIERFREMVESGSFLEWAQYGSHLYGTPLAPVLATLDQGSDVLLEIEMQGARQVAAAYPDAVLVFIRPPSMAVLEQRLRSRGDTDDDDIERRLEIARHELAEAEALFDHIVVNEEVGAAIDEVVRIIDQERASESTDEHSRARESTRGDDGRGT